MHSGDLTIMQARALWHDLTTMTAYMRRLHNRMDDLQFAKDNELYVLVAEAHRAMEQVTAKALRMGFMSVG